LVATPDCKPKVPSSNPVISPAYSGLPILGWEAFGMVLHYRQSSEGGRGDQLLKYKKGASSPPKKKLRKKKLHILMRSVIAKKLNDFIYLQNLKLLSIAKLNRIIFNEILVQRMSWTLDNLQPDSEYECLVQASSR
jgi:hypothetical protein